MKTKEIEAQLEQFTGTTAYHMHRSLGAPLKLTDGALFVREECNSYWLFDLISSYQHQFAATAFQVWVFTRKQGKCEVRCEDGNKVVLIRQMIPFSDFPLDELKLWKIDDVVLLPSEY